MNNRILKLVLLLVIAAFFPYGPAAHANRSPLELKSILAGRDSVTMDWTDSGSKYRVYQDQKLVYEGTESRYEDSRLNPGYTYIYRIEAVNEADAVVDSLKLQTGTDKPGRNPLENLNDLMISTVVKKDQMTMDWEDLEGVSEYGIYKNKAYVKTVKESEYRDYRIHPERANTYRIVAIRNADQAEIVIEKTIGRFENHFEKRWIFRYTTFLADQWVKNPNPFSRYAWFMGDHRGYDATASSFRTRADVTICFCSEAPSVTLKKLVGATRVYDANKNLLAGSASSSGGIELDETDVSGGSRIAFRLKHAVGNPYVNGMDINYEVRGEFYGNGSYKLSGRHDQAPHHEAYLKGDNGASYEAVHQAASKGLIWLAPPMPNKTWSKSNF